MAARRLVGDNCDPVLNGFPEFLAIIRQSCSAQIAAYRASEVCIADVDFLDMLNVLASDAADPASVPNPPARIRSALSRQRRQEQTRDRRRGMPLYEASLVAEAGRGETRAIESGIIVRVDWEHGQRQLGLPAEQAQAIAARYEGASLQSAEAAACLGWEAPRVAAVRRSLEADRPWGKLLRQHFAAYLPKKPKCNGD